MKQFALALLGVALSVPALSQSSDSKIKAYLRGGVNYNLSGVGLDSGLVNAGSIARLESPINGWHAGLTVRDVTSVQNPLPAGVRGDFILHRQRLPRKRQH